MKNIIQDIKTSNFINKFDWYSLSCHDRAQSILAESLIDNASYCFLLLKFMGRNYLKRNQDLAIGDDDYYKFIEEKTGIKYALTLKDSSNFFEDIKNCINNNDHLVLITNNRYEDESYSFNKENHCHFVVLKGYDEINDRYLVIDEDFSKQYWKASNYKDGVEYVEKFIDAEKLKRLCTNISSFNKFKDMKKDFDREDFYGFYKVEKQDSCKVFSLENILNLYKDQLKYIIDNSDNQLKFVINNAVKFKESLNKDKNCEEDYIFYLKEWYVYPDETATIGCHHFNLYTQKRFFEIKLEENETKNTLMNYFDEILSGYLKIRNAITKSIIFGDIKTYDKIMPLFEQLFFKEVDLYKFILESKIAEMAFGNVQ